MNDDVNIIRVYLFDVVTGFGARLDKHDVELAGFTFAFFCGDLTFVREVSLVAYQHDDDVTAAFGSHVVDPFGSLVERVGI